MGKSTISMAMFNSYFDITKGYICLMFGLGFHIGFARLYRPVCMKIQLEADASNDHKHQGYSSKFEHLFGCHLL